MNMIAPLTQSQYEQYEQMYRYICNEMIPALWAQYGVMPAEQWLEEMTTAQSMRVVWRDTLNNGREEGSDVVSRFPIR